MAKQKSASSLLNIQASQFSPITQNQGVFASAFDSGLDILMMGCAGTGKTFCAISKAFESLMTKMVRRIIIVRSTVPSRDQGFLPGDVEEKAAIYEMPYRAIVNEICSRGDAYDILKRAGQIEFQSSSYLRGLTFDNAIVIVDEIQNMTWEEINTIYTRLGENCQCILCGDFYQTDYAVGKSGMGKMLGVINQMPNFQVVKMGVDDIVRSERVKAWIIATGEIETAVRTSYTTSNH